MTFKAMEILSGAKGERDTMTECLPVVAFRMVVIPRKPGGWPNSSLILA